MTREEHLAECERQFRFALKAEQAGKTDLAEHLLEKAVAAEQAAEQA